MPKTQKTTAKKATAKTASSNTIKTNEQALQKITSNQTWSLFKGEVVAAACQLYQSGQLKSADDISALLTPLNDEIRAAIGIATGLNEGKQEDKLITMILNGHSLSESIDILKQMGSITLSVEQAKKIILAHQEDADRWQETSLKDRYYPIVYLHEIITNSSFSVELAFGIDDDGDRALLNFRIGLAPYYGQATRPTLYRQLLQELKERQLPAPLLVGGDYQGSDFCQQQLAKFFPQSYFIPTLNSTSTTVREKVDPSYALRNDYRQMFKALYQSQSLEEYKEIVPPLIHRVCCWNILENVNKQWRPVFCPEVVQALLALPPTLRKVLCAKPPFVEAAENLKTMLNSSALRDTPYLKVMVHQYYLQMLCPEWQRSLGNWKRLKSDLQSFTQMMQHAQDRAAQVVQANAQTSK